MDNHYDDEGNLLHRVPLTGAQARFFARNHPDPHYYNIAKLLEVPATLDPVLLKEAVRQLLLQHEALRIRFSYDQGNWQQYIVDSDRISDQFIYRDLSDISDEESRDTIKSASSGFQKSFNLCSGSLLRVVYFYLGQQRPGRLLLIVHHLVADALSIPIIISDLQQAYEQLSRGEEVHLPPKTTSLQEWNQRVVTYVHTPRFQQDLAYWFSQSWGKIGRLPVDKPEGLQANTRASLAYVETALSDQETKDLLRTAPRLYKTPYTSIALTAFVKAFESWTGRRALQLYFVLNGRNVADFGDIATGVDLSRTVGWLSMATEHLILDLGSVLSPLEEVRTIHRQIQNMPRGGACDRWAYLCQDTSAVARLRSLPAYEVQFNYYGRYSPPSLILPFREVAEPIGPSKDPDDPLEALLTCQSILFEGRYAIRWQYSRNIFHQETIEALAQNFMQALREIIYYKPATVVIS